MPLPAPEVGLVVSYAYLWSDEAAAGAEEARKDRPCAIVLAVRTAGDEIEVVVAPVTHRTPADPEIAIELPAVIKKLLGLDEARSWLILEFNRFVWPGPDLRPRLGANPQRFDYGFLPPRFFEQIKARIRAVSAARRLGVVRRTP